MTSPQPQPLNLQQGCIEKPTMSDVAAIDAAMLWPDDDVRRRQVTDLANVEMMLARPDLYSKEFIVEGARAAMLTPFSRASLQAEWQTRCWEGLVAGMFLL